MTKKRSNYGLFNRRRAILSTVAAGIAHQAKIESIVAEPVEVPWYDEEFADSEELPPPGNGDGGGAARLDASIARDQCSILAMTPVLRNGEILARARISCAQSGNGRQLYVRLRENLNNLQDVNAGQPGYIDIPAAGTGGIKYVYSKDVDACRYRPGDFDKFYTKATFYESGGGARHAESGDVRAEFSCD